MAKKQIKQSQKQTKKVVSNKSQKSMIITILSLIVIVVVILLMVSTTLKESMDNKSSADGGRKQECQMNVAVGGVAGSKKVKAVKCRESVEIGYYIDLNNSKQMYCTNPAYPVARGCSYTDFTE